MCMRLSLHYSSMVDVLCKAFGPCYGFKRFSIEGRLWIHSAPLLNSIEKVVEKQKISESGSSAYRAGVTKFKRKKLKGKRAVVRWLKHFRFKKKKEYERMTAEEKLLYKLRKVNFQFIVILLINFKFNLIRNKDLF